MEPDNDPQYEPVASDIVDDGYPFGQQQPPHQQVSNPVLRNHLARFVGQTFGSFTGSQPTYDYPIGPQEQKEEGRTYEDNASNKKPKLDDVKPMDDVEIDFDL